VGGVIGEFGGEIRRLDMEEALRKNRDEFFIRCGELVEK
jgi:hypothetical protein